MHPSGATSCTPLVRAPPTYFLFFLSSPSPARWHEVDEMKEHRSEGLKKREEVTWRREEGASGRGGRRETRAQSMLGTRRWRSSDRRGSGVGRRLASWLPRALPEWWLTGNGSSLGLRSDVTDEKHPTSWHPKASWTIILRTSWAQFAVSVASFSWAAPAKLGCGKKHEAKQKKTQI